MDIAPKEREYWAPFYPLQAYLKGYTTARNVQWLPKKGIRSPRKVGVIYRLKYAQVRCEEGWIYKLARTSGDRFKEHLRDPSPIYDHGNTSGHCISVENFSIVGRDAN